MPQHYHLNKTPRNRLTIFMRFIQTHFKFIHILYNNYTHIHTNIWSLWLDDRHESTKIPNSCKTNHFWYIFSIISSLFIRRLDISARPLAIRRQDSKQDKQATTTMDSVKSFFANPNKESNLGNQQNGVTAGRWSGWNRSLQAHSDPGSARNGAMRDGHPTAAKRKDSDSYFYIMWVWNEWRKVLM